MLKVRWQKERRPDKEDRHLCLCQLEPSRSAGSVVVVGWLTTRLTCLSTSPSFFDRPTKCSCSYALRRKDRRSQQQYDHTATPGGWLHGGSSVRLYFGASSSPSTQEENHESHHHHPYYYPGPPRHPHRCSSPHVCLCRLSSGCNAGRS